MTVSDTLNPNENRGFVTAKLSGHWFALPIDAVNEVFLLSKITEVPQSPPGVIGILNLRGRIVTAVDIGHILGFAPSQARQSTAIGVEKRGELFGLAVDTMGDVLTSASSSREVPPANLDRRWKEIVTGIDRSNGNLVLIVSVDRLFDGIMSLVGT